MKRALLIHPPFSENGFWNYVEVCRLLGAKYPAPPLGLVTMAALLPRAWQLKLVDMNAEPLSDADIDAAGVVFTGGMLPQQPHTLELIARCHRRGKKVVVGGPDPTSQPEVYREADYLVLGEAESSCPPFLRDLERGVPSGIYRPSRRPDMAASPVPRYELLNFNNYLMVGVQFSRGCPFNCEFCDIIELYGRIPRTKTPRQIINELEYLYRLGYRGHVDFVDDNFIGHKQKAKQLLRSVLRWSTLRKHPFFFSTEASLNLADDEELLRLMQALDFRYVFVGIESPEEQVLASIHKRANLNRDIVRDLHKIYRAGMVVNAGFILGFDHENSESAGMLLELVGRGKICMAMVGLLCALPNTQLARRLEREGRLFGRSTQWRLSAGADIDQLSSGINFATKRPREDVLRDFLRIIEELYSARGYFNRCLALSRTLKVHPAYRPSWRRVLRYARGLLATAAKLGLRRETGWYFLRNLIAVGLSRPSSLETAVNLMAMYLHFGPQSRFIARGVRRKLQALRAEKLKCAGAGKGLTAG